MLQFGFTNPVLVDEQNIVIAGHGRLLAAADLGLKEVPVIVISGLGDAEQRALALTGRPAGIVIFSTSWVCCRLPCHMLT
ncbi:ParB/Srx family N-terminal domain-containing protein [Bradyrhizobium sp. TZ2]